MLTQDAKRLGIHKSQNTPAAKKAKVAFGKAEKVLSDALTAETNAKEILMVAKNTLDAAPADMPDANKAVLAKSLESATEALTEASTVVEKAQGKVNNLKK